MRSTPLAMILLACLAAPAAAGTFQDIGVAGGQLTGLSHNGRIASGVGGDGAWRWNKDRGATSLTGFVAGNGMNDWAQPVAGAWIDTDGHTVAALAYSNSDLVGGPVVIGAWPGGVGFDNALSEAYDVSDTGVAVGLAYDADSTAFAFRWTAGEGMTRLTLNRPANSSRANAISSDGSTVVGWNDQDDGSRTGVIWQAGVPLDLVDALGHPVGEATAVNADGSIVVGSGYDNPDTGNSEAWRWTAATGVQSIGCVQATACGPAFAFALSEDGNTIVGASGFGIDRVAMIWTPASGLKRLSDYATAHAVTIPAGWTLASATGLSADGQSIGGWGPGPVGIGSYVIDLHENEPREAILEAHGVVGFNDLPSGPFAGIAAGTNVTMSFRLTPDGATELEPGEATVYPIELDTFQLTAGTSSDALVATQSGPTLFLANDYPLSDGFHLFSTPLASGQLLEFELFNPGGDLFDSDDLNRVNRTVGPAFFEKIAWSVSQGDNAMTINLTDVGLHDIAASSDVIFANGFD
jgi:hypothetical protein